MNINVLVCDDEVEIIEKIIKKLNNYDRLDIYTFSSYEELESNIHSINPHIAFIDIQFGEHTGFEVIGLLKKINPECIFTFFTNYSEYLKQGYEYRIYRYILKEEPDELIDKQIRETIEEYYKMNKYISIPYDCKDILITMSDIVYIEIVNHRSIIHMTDDKTYTWYKSLSEIAEEFLDSSFVRCHNSYIINLSHIMYINKKANVVMKNEISLDIGRRYKKEFFEKYNSFYSNGR